ncbi:hypothetical protein GH714_028179 [Hevea brasiliensis]|uniref:Uncharacterized protein n=1 Tax=Hevea brasiliensis TaxID=3981 RepID=A0A6A6LVJ2_HEVBR|nr:hypothetical protein GH714_028179 [Hevea brasiliensis]
MSQELKEQNLQSTPIAYFGAACSSLDRLSLDPDPPSYVRKQANTCSRDVLQGFQGTPALIPASEGITNTLERFLLLAGGSNTNETEGPRGAQEVLYILDTLKECLPLISMKCKNHLKYYKTLLELRQPVVTRRITDSLNVICLHMTSDVSSEALLDLLCSLALSASANETSVDNLTFTARLLDSGMRKVYSLNRQICVVKLPLIFSTLKDILASEHEEAIFAATEALKSLITNCIDELHECLGSALGAMGPETYLSLLPLKLEADDLSEFELEGRIVSARSADALLYSLWSLLPSFCNYPLDTAESFKDLEKALCSALREECDIRGILCTALQNLIQQNKRIVEGNDDLNVTEVGIARQRAMTHYSPQVAADNLSVLRSSARDFLTVLSGVLLESSKDDGGCLQSIISEFASIADKAVVKRIFLKTMRKLLEVTQKATNAEASGNSNSARIDVSSNEKPPSLERAQLFDLAVSLLPGLDGQEIGVLFSAVKPALQDAEGLIQKKAYKVLSIIIRKCDGFLSSELEELLQLMIDVLPCCHFSAKRHRLDCLHFLIVHVSKGDSEQRRRGILSSFLTEIILALKEANKKTRNTAYDVLVQIGHACGDEENGGNRENLYQFFNMVLIWFNFSFKITIIGSIKALIIASYIRSSDKIL